MPRFQQGHPPNFASIHPDRVNPAHHALTGGVQLVPHESGATRSRNLQTELQERIDSGLVDEFFVVLRGALKSEIWVRGSENGRLAFVRIPDWSSRLTAVRLGMAYKFGNPVSASEIRVLCAPGDAPKRLTISEQIAELRATGADIEGILRSWMKTVENVTPVPSDPFVAQPGEPTAPIADAYLDI